MSHHPTRALNVRLTTEDHQMLAALARASRRSMSNVMRMLIANGYYTHQAALAANRGMVLAVDLSAPANSGAGLGQLPAGPAAGGQGDAPEGEPR